MGNHKFSPQYEDYRTETDRFLENLFLGEPLYSDLYASIRYRLLAGGKRIRPALTLEFADLCGMDWHKALPVACAVELVHTYSLIPGELCRILKHGQHAVHLRLCGNPGPQRSVQ